MPAKGVSSDIESSRVAVLTPEVTDDILRFPKVHLLYPRFSSSSNKPSPEKDPTHGEGSST